MLEKLDLWAHRLWMVFALPLAIACAIIIGPFIGLFIGLEIVYEKFKEHWE